MKKWAVILSMLLVMGCTTRRAKVTKPDGTIFELEVVECFRDKEIGDLDIAYDPVRGVYTMNLANYGSRTSEMATDIALAAYEAGRKAAMAAMAAP